MKLKNVFCFVFAIIVCAMSVFTPALADNTAKSYISLPDGPLHIGDQFTVTVNVVGTDSNIGCIDASLSYHSSVVEFVSSESANGSSGTVRISAYDATNTNKNMLVSMTFKAIGTGKTYFTFTPNEVTDIEENALTCTQSSIGINVVSDQLSDNANLSSIKVSNGSLSPQFSSDITSYSVKVANSVDEVVISATAADEGADVEISGSDYIDVGENNRTITVTAADGKATKSYTVKITRAYASSQSSQTTQSSSAQTNSNDLSSETTSGNDELTVAIGSKKYTIIQAIDEKILPNGFVLDTQYYNNIECDVAYNKKADITLFYMQDQDGNCDFYAYNAETKEFYSYLVLKSDTLSLSILDKPTTVEIPEFFTDAVLDVNGTSYDAWKLDYNDYKGYYLVYGMTGDGEKDLYLYDSKQNTLQKYVNIVNTVKVYDEEQQNNSLYTTIAIIALSLICAVLFTIIIVLCIKHREYKF